MNRQFIVTPGPGGRRGMKRRQSNQSNTGGKGGKRMKEFGYKCVQVWLDPSEVKAIDQAAAKEGMRRASWIRRKAIEAAGGRFVLM